MKKMLLALMFFMVVCTAGNAWATTWGEGTVTCPVCDSPNKCYVVMSFGTYIFSWESKFQFIFWPRTDGNVLYTCIKCKYSALMWDFATLPKDKIKTVKDVVSKLKLDKKYTGYTEISITTRLEMAEKIYKSLDKDDDFWCTFYRTMGYHYEEAKMEKQATASRKQALALAEKMLKDPKKEGDKKELLLICGAMRHFLKDNKGALKDFESALKLKCTVGENAEGKDTYLTELLKEYQTLIQNETKNLPEQKADAVKIPDKAETKDSKTDKKKKQKKAKPANDSPLKSKPKTNFTKRSVV